MQWTKHIDICPVLAHKNESLKLIHSTPNKISILTLISNYKTLHHTHSFLLYISKAKRSNLWGINRKQKYGIHSQQPFLTKPNHRIGTRIVNLLGILSCKAQLVWTGFLRTKPFGFKYTKNLRNIFKEVTGQVKTLLKGLC